MFAQAMSKTSPTAASMIKSASRVEIATLLSIGMTTAPCSALSAGYSFSKANAIESISLSAWRKETPGLRRPTTERKLSPRLVLSKFNGTKICASPINT